MKEISSKNTVKKIKIATKLHRQFSHPSSKKLCDLVKNAGVTDPEFIKILQTLPNSCDYASVTRRLNLNQFLKILIWCRWPVVQILGFLCISRHPRKESRPSVQTESHLHRVSLLISIILHQQKSARMGMKSLLTLERNFLSPDVQRRERICTPGKASISYRQYVAEVDDKLSETMNRERESE